MYLQFFYYWLFSVSLLTQLPPMPEKGALYLAPSGVLVDQKSYVYPVDTLLADPSVSNPETLVRDVIDAIEYCCY